jgi:hypothetical protein
MLISSSLLAIRTTGSSLSPRRSQRKRKTNCFYSSDSIDWVTGNPRLEQDTGCHFEGSVSDPILVRGGISHLNSSRANNKMRRKPLFPSQEHHLPPRHGVTLTTSPGMKHTSIANPHYSPVSPRFLSAIAAITDLICR